MSPLPAAGTLRSQTGPHSLPSARPSPRTPGQCWAGLWRTAMPTPRPLCLVQCWKLGGTYTSRYKSPTFKSNKPAKVNLITLLLHPHASCVTMFIYRHVLLHSTIFIYSWHLSHEVAVFVSTPMHCSTTRTGGHLRECCAYPP